MRFGEGEKNVFTFVDVAVEVSVSAELKIIKLRHNSAASLIICVAHLIG